MEKDTIVEAIDDGKIVFVPESYARIEGLPIVRRPEAKITGVEERSSKAGISKNEKKGLLKFEEFRKPLKEEGSVLSELKDNFHWELLSRRKEKSLTRKQVSQAINVNEYELKMIEHGILLNEDFILVNKLQEFYGINLRKDGKDFSRQMRKEIEGPKEDIEVEEDL